MHEPNLIKDVNGWMVHPTINSGMEIIMAENERLTATGIFEIPSGPSLSMWQSRAVLVRRVL
jgi:hypothetical protein